MRLDGNAGDQRPAQMCKSGAWVATRCKGSHCGRLCCQAIMTVLRAICKCSMHESDVIIMWCCGCCTHLASHSGCEFDVMDFQSSRRRGASGGRRLGSCADTCSTSCEDAERLRRGTDSVKVLGRGPCILTQQSAASKSLRAAWSPVVLRFQQDQFSRPSTSLLTSFILSLKKLLKSPPGTHSPTLYTTAPDEYSGGWIANPCESLDMSDCRGRGGNTKTNGASTSKQIYHLRAEGHHCSSISTHAALHT